MSRFADEKQVVCLFVFKGGGGGKPSENCKVLLVNSCPNLAFSFFAWWWNSISSMSASLPFIGAYCRICE